MFSRKLINEIRQLDADEREKTDKINKIPSLNT